MSIVLFSYRTTYKVVTCYTPYELVYGLHLLMPTKYVLLVISGDHIDVEPTKVLTTRITELEKLHENKLEAQNNVGINQWKFFMWNQQKNTKKKFQFGDYVLWFPKGEKTHFTTTYCAFLRRAKPKI